MARAAGGHGRLRTGDLAWGGVSLIPPPGMTAGRELSRRAIRSRLTAGSRAGADGPPRRHPATRALPARPGCEQEQGEENAADPHEKWQRRHWAGEQGE